MPNSVDPANVRKYLLDLQADLCRQLSAEDEKGQFETDQWARPNAEGCTRVLMDGKVIERAGVNFSHVTGETLPPAATSAHPELNGCRFEAMGVSVIIHPLNPYVPTAHANVRFFRAIRADAAPVWWFGGGFDLTPYYIFEEDCIHWHQIAAKACAPFGKETYPRFKAWADRYFYLKHREEPRGIGGIFFDDLKEWPFETCFAFMRSVGDHFIHAYRPLMAKRKEMVFGERERTFQLYRRGRYVEFNLICDRGTLFGLQTGGRTESILMSLPPAAVWRYQWQPIPGSPEEKLISFLEPRDWVDL